MFGVDGMWSDSSIDGRKESAKGSRRGEGKGRHSQRQGGSSKGVRDRKPIKSPTKRVLSLNCKCSTFCDLAVINVYEVLKINDRTKFIKIIQSSEVESKKSHRKSLTTTTAPDASANTKALSGRSKEKWSEGAEGSKQNGDGVTTTGYKGRVELDKGIGDLSALLQVICLLFGAPFWGKLLIIVLSF